MAQRRKKYSRYQIEPVGGRKGLAYGRGEAKAVNDIWHVDFAGPFVTSDGHKCWGLVAGRLFAPVADAVGRDLAGSSARVRLPQ